MNFKLRLLAMLLLVMIVFTSCSLDIVLQYIPGMGCDSTTTTTTTTTTTAKPTTTKPTTTTTTTLVQGGDNTPKWNRADHSTTQAELLERYDLTQEYVDNTLALLDRMYEVSITATSIEEIDPIYEEFEAAFYHIAQQMTIAMIVYYCNMSNEEATNRQLATNEMFYSVQDKYNEVCRDILNESPFAEELFADWSEEELESLRNYNSDAIEIKKELDALEAEYNDLGADGFDDKAAEIYAQMVTKNNQLAKIYGYDNYYDYATENVYSRDYDRENLVKFRDYVIEYVFPCFSGLYNRYAAVQNLPKDQKTVVNKFMNGKFDSGDTNYLLEYLDSLEGSMGESMRHMFENKNCVFSGKPTSHPTAFQTYLYEDETPICLFGSQGQSATTMVHEIGHYYAALKNNDLSSYDLLETHSQSNEFLFLEFASHKLPEAAYDVVYAYQLVNACYIIVMATIIDEFEQRVYALDSVEGFTSADFDAIMDDVCKAYGGTDYVAGMYADPLNYWRQVCVTNPVYYISYAVSAVAALEVNALVLKDKDAAYTAYTTLVEGVTVEDGFVGALTKAGLTSPFEEQTFVDIAATLK